MSKEAGSWGRERDLLVSLLDGALQARHDNHSGVGERTKDRQQQATDEPGVHNLTKAAAEGEMRGE